MKELRYYMNIINDDDENQGFMITYEPETFWKNPRHTSPYLMTYYSNEYGVQYIYIPQEVFYFLMKTERVEYIG